MRCVWQVEVVTSSSLSIAHFRRGFNEKWPKTRDLRELSVVAQPSVFGVKYLNGVKFFDTPRSVDLGTRSVRRRGNRRTAERHVPAFALVARPSGENRFEV